MATVSKDPASGNFHIRFRFGGRAYRRSLKTTNRRESLAVLGKVEETIRLLDRGSISMPENAEPATFIISGGQLDTKPSQIASHTLGQLCEEYQSSLPVGAKEKSTLKTERIHFGHLHRILGRDSVFRSITTTDLQTYVNTRLAEANGASVKPVTVKKEMATFRFIWNWGMSRGYVKTNSPTKGLQFPKEDEHLPFMTWHEIEKVIKRGGLSEDEEAELWAALYL